MQPIGNPPPSWDECVEILERLPSMPLDNRVEALERLVRNPSPGIREQALRIGASVFPDSRLTEYLRDPADAALRSAGSEIFRLRGVRSLPVVAGLLQDPDPDVVLQAVLILDRLRDPRALEPLHVVLGHADPNVRQEAILAIGHLGDARSIPHLLPFLKADFWVQMAAVQALGDLRAPEAVPHLAERLTDPLVGSLAAEALARIGGEPAFRALAAHWPAGDVEIDDETMLGLLAHVLEGLPHPEETGALPGGLREALSARLHDRSAEARTAAARCLLVLGPSPWDGAAVEVLAASRPTAVAVVRPAALARRRDLAGPLLAASGEPQAWGFQLAASFPEDVPAEAFLTAVREVAERRDLLPSLLQALEKVRVPGLGEALLDLYLCLPDDGARESLGPALEAHRDDMKQVLAAHPGLAEADRLVLSALLGRPLDEVAGALLDLDPPSRPDVVSRLLGLAGLMAHLPWDDWLAEAPELYSALAAEAAVRCGFRDLLPALRARAAAAPSEPLLRALGALGDREAVPVLASCLEREDLRLAALESLGRIGGPEARAALQRATCSLEAVPEARAAFKALSACAGAGDDATFRAAAGHPDWQVRLTSVEVLGRFPRPENMAVLTRLAGDPVAAVAHRALAVLEG
ncbi:MAG TPA: HEAT repeat domain-containing protein [Thermoanaerobaculia bacterium]|jgi:HEAT repeat protein|nr:HEAT repeat domain-containing protein [Thermoanaerobaculia bacterium]